MRLHEARRDLYRRLARERGYRSRAAFKLIQANEKYGFIMQGHRVVDFGAAPGGWLQVASEAVGDSGIVVGVDILPISLKERNARILKMDVNDPAIGESLLSLLGGRADVVLSDLAPSVSGVWQIDHGRQVDLTLRVLELSRSVLKSGGSAFMKVFEGERSNEARSLFRSLFDEVRAVKPKASRSQSAELYYLCTGWRP